MDCSKTEVYLAEKARMSKNCKIPCGDRPLGESLLHKDIYECTLTEMEYPDESVLIVQDWSDEHPRKTRLQDFLEKYPKAKLEKDGTPKFCVCGLGYFVEEEYCIDKNRCYDCWRTPLEEGRSHNDI